MIRTHLHPAAVPGKKYTFTAKTPDVGGPHIPGRIVALGLMALPGRTRIFVAKTPQKFPPAEVRKGKLHGWNKRRVLQWGGKYPPRR